MTVLSGWVLPPRPSMWRTVPPTQTKSAELPAQADSVATTIAALKDDFNALLSKLRAAGLMTSADAGGDET